MKRTGGKKKIKEELTVQTSISNTVAHTIFKPDAGLQKLREIRKEWGKRSSSCNRLFGRNVV